MTIKILVVEDDERIRTAVRLALEKEGWEVFEAASGEEALEIFKNQICDIVLIDIMLPGIDGFEVCRALRRISDLPIVMVTARDDTHDVVAGLFPVSLNFHSPSSQSGIVLSVPSFSAQFCHC